MLMVHLELTYEHTIKDTLYTDSSIDTPLFNISIEETDTTLSVELTPKQAFNLLECSLYIETTYSPSTMIFQNSYLSSSVCKLNPISSIDKGISRLSKLISRNQNLINQGDYGFYTYPNIEGILHSWNYTYQYDTPDTLNFWGSLNENDCFTIFIHNKKTSKLQIKKDITCLEIHDQPIHLFNLFHTTDTREQVFKEYCEKMQIQHKPRVCFHGFSSTFEEKSNSNELDLLTLVEHVANSPIPNDVFLLDSIYQPYMGDWLEIDPTRFPNTLRPIVNKIHEYKMQAGILLSPLLCEKNSTIFKDYQDWLLRDKKGRLLKVKHEAKGIYALDITLPEVKEYIRTLLLYYSNQGFDFFKLDGLYVTGLKEQTTQTRAQQIRDAIRFIRHCIPNKMVLACSVPLFSTSGYTEFVQITPDNSLGYEPSWPLLLNEQPSTKGALFNLITRRELNDYLFNATSAPYAITNAPNLSRKQAFSIFKLTSMFSNTMFSKDIGDAYTADEFQILNDFFKQSWQDIDVDFHDKAIYFKGMCNNTKQSFYFDFEIGCIRESEDTE